MCKVRVAMAHLRTARGARNFRDKMIPMPGADEAAVRRASAGFYAAFESLDVAAMEQVWAHDEQVLCVHPGREHQIGWPAVRASWQELFKNTLQIELEVHEIALHISGDLAAMSVTETLRSSAPGGGGLVGQVNALNLFARRGGSWRLVARHATPLRGRHSVRDAAVH